MTIRRHCPLLALLFTAGCSQPDGEDLQAYIDRINARPPGPLGPLPAIPQVDTFTYVPDDRRDPFAMDERVAEIALPVPGGGIAPDPLRRKEELEQYSLDALRMVGTLEQDDQSWALIIAPDGILHRVRVGNYLGRNHGQITRITPAIVQLTEIIPDGPERWREREASIALKQ
ncbi:pilus assembly protein PilP [Thiohalocapsa marina]|uniref:Pilus assembly protein PilP n=1 Tax=Thiohalocapsa marina TaxID=424902 RepID=A0A5M8FKU1_9GAMM|nr:pilus assembly protein PilP [Thiohalocapsa marina]KAA6185518.1 pilus assembly protein PilP [Thiohalocapsa marina]